MRWQLRYLICGSALCVSALAMGVFIRSELPPTRTWSELGRSAQTVNRATKGDRLPLLLHPAINSNIMNGLGEIIFQRAPVFDSYLPDGCESLVSSMAHSSLVNIAGRCLS
jgi:hypothetical protein